jgi:hypothetical protein
MSKSKVSYTLSVVAQKGLVKAGLPAEKDREIEVDLITLIDHQGIGIEPNGEIWLIGWTIFGKQPHVLTEAEAIEAIRLQLETLEAEEAKAADRLSKKMQDRTITTA